MNRRLAALGSVLAALAITEGAWSHEAHEEKATPPVEALASPRFAPPEPGTYELPPIQKVASFSLLDHKGRPAPLLSLAEDEFAVVSFVFLSCGSACPAATATLQSLDRDLATSELADKVELVTVSFDPARDTPEKMEAQRNALRPKGRWRFLTAPDLAGIEPVLTDFGQHVSEMSGPDGEPTDQLQHVLKVFLVDGSGSVRNIYSTGFLDRRLLMNDLLTLSSASEGSSSPLPLP